MQLSRRNAEAVEVLIDRDQWTHLAGGNTTITSSQGSPTGPPHPLLCHEIYPGMRLSTVD